MINIKNSKNPVLPVNIHIPDPEAHVMPDGKLCIYGSFDDSYKNYCSDKYHVVSTINMNEWAIHSNSFSADKVTYFNDPNRPRYQGIDWNNPTPFISEVFRKSNIDISKMANAVPDNTQALLYAPDCIFKEGKYYLYFCMSDDSEGVAVSDNPYGPFDQAIQLPCGGIDPAVFVDDDGQAYYYWGQLNASGVKLNDDMTSFDDTDIRKNILTEKEHFFHEGSSMRKIGSKYYMVYSDMSRGKPTSLGYATSTSPLGPFEYQGIIIDNSKCDPKSWNNHGSIEKFNGKWYVFYHRSSRGSKKFRRLCIEEIEILENGKIQEVVMTSQGVGTPFRPGEKIFGEHFCEISGTLYVDFEDEMHDCLTNICFGDEAIIRYVQSETGFKGVEIVSEGSGEIDIFIGEDKVCTAEIINDESVTYCKFEYSGTGMEPVRLKFNASAELKIKELMFI